MRNFCKAQAIVEFALVLPLMLLLLMGIIYSSMIFADYMSLSSIARSSAREAAVANDEYYANDYAKVRANYSDAELPLDFYDWSPNSTDDFSIAYDKENRNVIVTLKASLNANGSSVAGVMQKLANMTNSNFDLNITYTMYSENTH